MTRLAPRSITEDCFPTPALILRANDPASQRDMRTFAHKQAEAARSLHQKLTDALRRARNIDERAAAFASAFSAAEDWRYWIAAANPHPTGRYSAGHAERFRTPVTDDNPNFFRIGEPERFTDGAAWNPITRTYAAGAETPASHTMRRFAALAATRFAEAPNLDIVCNRVALTDGRVAGGTRLLRGAAAHRAATEIASRIGARGGDTSRIITDGDLLYQAPRRKRGSDATIRTFLIAAGTSLLGYPPPLLHDIDLRAYLRPAEQFVAELRAAAKIHVHAPAVSLLDRPEHRLTPAVGQARPSSAHTSPVPPQCSPTDAAPSGQHQCAWPGRTTTAVPRRP